MSHREDTKTFLLLINECEGILQKVCKLYFDSLTDREDVYQDILLNAWKSYPAFKGESKFSTWLYRVALNTAFTKLKKKTKITVLHDISGNVLEIPFEERSDKQAEVTMLYAALHQLGQLDKTIAFLYLDQLSYKEIAAITGLPEKSIGVRISRVKEKIKKILLDYGIR